MSRDNTLVCGDTEYVLTAAYRRGASALRDGISCNANPFRNGCQSHEEWSNGHINESAGEHVRFGRDLIEAEPAGEYFKEDPEVPREASGDVEPDWYAQALAGLNNHPTQTKGVRHGAI